MGYYYKCTCISFFRSRKNDLKEMCTLLYPCLLAMHFNNMLYAKVICQNQYIINFETRMCVISYRFSRPSRLRPDMERFFSKLSSIIYTFTNAMNKIANLYLYNLAIVFNCWEFLSNILLLKRRQMEPYVVSED